MFGEQKKSERSKDMILSGTEIKNRLGKDIIISPFSEQRVNPNSYNLRLAPMLYIYDVPKNEPLDPRKKYRLSAIEMPPTGLVLEPGRLYLGFTVEWTETYNLVPLVEGRSSLGRLGLFVHITAGFGDNGYRGRWTLELSCVQPVVVYPYMEVCQIYFHTIAGDTSMRYKGKYNGAGTVLGSKLHQEFKEAQHGSIEYYSAMGGEEAENRPSPGNAGGVVGVDGACSVLK